MDVSSLITGSTAGTLIVAIAYAGRQLLDWWPKRGNGKRVEAAGAVADAAVANATLVQTVETLQRENGRMARKIKHLEDEAEEKDRKIDSLEAALEAAKADFTSRIDEMQAQLAALKGH